MHLCHLCQEIFVFFQAKTGKKNFSDTDADLGTYVGRSSVNFLSISCDKSQAGLPDSLFSNQKSYFG
jgi:hypothetical protein